MEKIHNVRDERETMAVTKKLEQGNKDAWTTDALKESEDRYLRILEITKKELLFYRHDVQGRFTYASPSYTEILGYHPEEYIGKTAEELWSNHPINKEADRKTKLSALGVRQASYELEIFHKNGACRRFVVIEAPIYNQDGQVVAVEGIARDITEKRHAEEQLEKYRQHLEDLVQQRTLELRTSEKQLHDIIDFLPDPTYVVDGNKKIISWNRAMVNITQVASQSAIGADYLDCIAPIHDACAPLLVDLILKHHEQSNCPQTEEHLLQQDGIARQGQTLITTRYVAGLHDGQGGYL
jgi:PAS domain S-box-containing protein